MFLSYFVSFLHCSVCDTYIECSVIAVEDKKNLREENIYSIFKNFSEHYSKIVFS